MFTDKDVEEAKNADQKELYFIVNGKAYKRYKPAVAELFAKLSGDDIILADIPGNC